MSCRVRRAETAGPLSTLNSQLPFVLPEAAADPGADVVGVEALRADPLYVALGEAGLALVGQAPLQQDRADALAAQLLVRAHRAELARSGDRVAGEADD